MEKSCFLPGGISFRPGLISRKPGICRELIAVKHSITLIPRREWRHADKTHLCLQPRLQIVNTNPSVYHLHEQRETQDTSCHEKQHSLPSSTPQAPKWPPHMFSPSGFSANILFKGSARTSRAFCSQVVWFVPFQMV